MPSPAFILGTALCALLLTSCSLNPLVTSTENQFAGGGFVVGDEPLAVEAGASTLALGGSAADAATAIYFALAVSYPVAAGLGGGGLCVARESNGNVESFSFLPRDTSAHGPYAIPGNVRGFAALQAAYGRLPWQRDVSPGEKMATAGFVVSAALAARLTAAQDVIRLDANLSAEFLDEEGHARTAGSRTANPDLGRTLAMIRTMGSDGLYDGPLAAKIASYGASQGRGIDAQDLHAYSAERSAADAVALDQGALLYLVPAHIGPGLFTKTLLTDLQKMLGESPTMTSSRAISLVTARALDQFHIGNLPQDLGSTSFAAMDYSGQAVACAVTLNAPFGSGHTVEGTGVTLAKTTTIDQPASGSTFLAPVIVVRDASLALAGAGAGGPNGTAAIISSSFRAASGENGPAIVRATGNAPYDTINGIVCGNGTCYAVPDPSAHGFAKAVGG